MAIALVSTVDGSWAGGVGGTTSAIDTTGADLITIVLTGVTPTATPTDSASNTWTSLTIEQATGTEGVVIWYVLSPTTSASHTFSITETVPTLHVHAWSGVASFDEEAAGANSNGATSLQPGSVTPNTDGALIITGIVWAANITSATVDASFDSPPASWIDAASGINYEAAMSYLIQGTAAAINPTWSWTTSSEVATTSAVFLAAASSGTPIIYQFPSPALGGAAVTLGDGTSRIHKFNVPAAEYGLPLWLVPDGDAGRAVRINALPATAVLKAGTISASSSEP